MNTRLLLTASCTLLVGACVDHRPIRNGLSNETVYLEKKDLTEPDTRFTAPDDHNWLYQTTVVGASSPNVVGDYAFPGLQGDVQMVNFRFRDNALQVINAQRLQEDRAGDPNDDQPSTEDNVMLEFAGDHVDVKLHESLDGERTNLLEENTEQPWQERQKFKIDFSSTSLDPITNAAWYYGEFLAMCASTVATHYVPDSFVQQRACTPEEVDAEYTARRNAWNNVCPGGEGEACDAARAAFLAKPPRCSETGGESLGFEVEVTYSLTVTGGCYDLVTLASGTGTTTIRYRFSFYRPKTGSMTKDEAGNDTFAYDYEPQVIEEKDITNKKYGVFQILNLFRDHDTGLLSAESLMKRWNPDRTEPATFYFPTGFPVAFKTFFIDEIEPQTNKVLEDANSSLRVAFKDATDGGVDRRPGDMRHSFINWHRNIDTTRGLLGYGPSTADPRTGEVMSAVLNLYEVGLDAYRFRIENFLEAKGGLLKPKKENCDPETDANKCEQAWEEIECEKDSTVAPGDPIRCDAEAAKATAKCEDEDTTDERDCDAEGEEAKATCLKRPRLASALFEEMRNTMDLPTGADATWEKEDFVPTPTMPETFPQHYRKVLPELRYAEPLYNAFVYRPSHHSQLPDLLEKKKRVHAFEKKLESITLNQDPFAGQALYSRDGIKSQLDFAAEFRSWQKESREIKNDQRMLFAHDCVLLFDDMDAINSVARSARKCEERKDGFTWESDKEFTERILSALVFKTAIHEFGHNMGLRHNFYGSVDSEYMRPGEVSASVMDYVAPWEEAATLREWGRYDELALSWIYGDEAAQEKSLAESPLYCTDEHSIRSPLCQTFDLGITPAQIVLNSLEQYDWLYEIRNKRAYRKFWDTTYYASGVYGYIFDVQRMWHLALFDWGGGGVQDILKRLDQVDDPENVLTSQEYDEIAMDFYNDISAAIGMTMAFYDSVLNQSASERNYMTEFDPFYGDVIRIGIIVDKLFATFAFMDLQDISYYDPNVSTYAAMYDAAFGTKNDALAQRVLDDMLGANYDTFPWFKYYALNIFAYVTNTNLIGNIQLRDRIAIRRYNRSEDLEAEFGGGVLDETGRADNTSGTFLRNGEEYVYTYLDDRAWHLVSSRSNSPVSFQFMKEYNEALRADAGSDTDNYGLKILLAYYEYYNNFVGF